MKKYIILLMTGIAAMLASCSQNEEPLAASDGSLQSVTFKLTADGSDLRTRATSTVAINRYVMEVYDQDGNTPVNVFGETHRAEQETSSFTFVLDRTKTYSCLFWADNDAADIYEVADLKAVTLKQNQKAIESSFYATKTVSGNATTYAVTLSRAVAKVRLGEKDRIKAGSTLTATYQAYTTFNVMDGALGQPAECTVTFDIATEISGTADVPTQVGEPFYVLAPNDESSVTAFSFKLNDEPEKTVDNVPVRANHSVFIRGEFSAFTDKTFSVTADDEWSATIDNHGNNFPLSLGDKYKENNAEIGPVILAEANKALVLLGYDLTTYRTMASAEEYVSERGGRLPTEAEFRALHPILKNEANTDLLGGTVVTDFKDFGYLCFGQGGGFVWRDTGSWLASYVTYRDGRVLAVKEVTW